MHASDYCATAAKLVSGERESTYGDKETNHDNIAMLWSAYLAVRRDPTAPISALDVAHMMILLKLARTQLGAGHHHDNYVDMAGYAGIAGQLSEAEMTTRAHRAQAPR
jgi:Domain of unknown function (DUF6378)